MKNPPENQGGVFSDATLAVCILQSDKKLVLYQEFFQTTIILISWLD